RALVVDADVVRTRACESRVGARGRPVREDALVEQEPVAHERIVRCGSRLAPPPISRESARMRGALVLCLAVAVGAPPLAGCGGPQIQERKVAELGKLVPATLEATRPKTGDPREAKIRVWVDGNVRAQ